jgi:hypothetical protein
MHARAEESAMIVGSGQFKYRVIAEWAKLPDGWSFKEVGGLASIATTTSMSSTAVSTR